MNKEEYLKYVDTNFNNKAKDITKQQIELFYKDNEVIKNKYQTGDDVYLKKGTFIHGIPGLLENFDWILENGFIGNEFTHNNVKNKIRHSIGMWNIQNDCYLRDYIIDYSGFTITYTIGRGPGSKEITELIPYHKFDEYTEKINDDEDIWMYWGDGTKEVRFIPSLVSNKRQIAFILNMESDIAKSMTKNDVWNTELEEETLIPFLDDRYYSKFLTERFNRTAVTTDRESAIIFGLPANLIEGIFVGRKIENDLESLKYIKNRLPDCYICNLDGKVIIGNSK